MSQISGIDVKKGMGILGNNAKLYLRLLNTFVKNTAMTEFMDAINAGDTETAATKAHAIKGVAANLSLSAITDLIADMEQTLKHGTVIAPSDASIAALKDAYDTTLKSIEAINADPGLLS